MYRMPASENKTMCRCEKMGANFASMFCCDILWDLRRHVINPKYD